MTELVIWSALMFLVPGVLWTIPRTRRMPGFFMTGYKTLPVGCAVTVLTPGRALRAWTTWASQWAHIMP